MPCVPLFKHLRLPSKGKYLKMKHFRFRDTVEADADVEAEPEPEAEATLPQCRGGGKCKVRKRGRCRGIFRRAGVGMDTSSGRRWPAGTHISSGMATLQHICQVCTGLPIKSVQERDCFSAHHDTLSMTCSNIHVYCFWPPSAVRDSFAAPVDVP